MLLAPAFLWLAKSSLAEISTGRRILSTAVRLIVFLLLVCGLAGLQWLRPIESLNIFFLLDRSESVSPAQKETARHFVNSASDAKKKEDRGGIVVFGSEAAIESLPNSVVDLQKIQAVIPEERTDIGAAIRLATAALPEDGQKRLVLLTDGHENIGDAEAAVEAAVPLGVSIDVLPLATGRGTDVALQRFTLPPLVKRAQPFEARLFVTSDRAGPGTLRIYRNEQLLGEQNVTLNEGKNLFTVSQSLDQPGFYSYTAVIAADADMLPQNNKATSFTRIIGNPRVLLISSEPDKDTALATALRGGEIELVVGPAAQLPPNVAELQSFDCIFLSNVSAGDLGTASMKLLESAVRDFGIGLVVIGGDQAFAAGGYRGTPLETALPVDMELESKKVLPNGALALVVHATEFPNGNKWARDIAFAALDALGPQDEMGIVLWDGNDKWLFPLSKVGNKAQMGNAISGMNPGDMPSFQGNMQMAHDALKASKANIKHMVVFSDGDPTAPTNDQLKGIIDDRITISAVMIGGHVSPQTMITMSTAGKGRFYDVRSPEHLPQIFVKEAAIILKAAIFEEPFLPRVAGSSEILKGISGPEFPALLGYVSTSPKARAEIPLLTSRGDPLLAQWQYGLGRAVAFTSDAKPRWAANWLSWPRYKQFWTQAALWAMRRIETADFVTEVSIEKGEGLISVEAVDEQGNYRNFLNLQATVISPKAEREPLRLIQVGPGRYEARFSTREVGSYVINLLELQGGVVKAGQVIGASLNYSPEFAASGINNALIQRITSATGGKVLDPANDNPFLRDRKKTFQPKELWETLLKLAIVLFTVDVGIRRLHIDRSAFAAWMKRKKTPGEETKADVSKVLKKRQEARVSTSELKEDLELPPQFSSGEPLPKIEVPEPVAPQPDQKAAPTQTTSERLLEAKRRARKNLE